MELVERIHLIFIIKLSDGNYIGYSNKIASGTDATPKINTK